VCLAANDALVAVKHRPMELVNSEKSTLYNTKGKSKRNLIEEIRVEQRAAQCAALINKAKHSGKLK
jgi:hypothetical protein